MNDHLQTTVVHSSVGESNTQVSLLLITTTKVMLIMITTTTKDLMQCCLFDISDNVFFVKMKQVVFVHVVFSLVKQERQFKILKIQNKQSWDKSFKHIYFTGTNGFKLPTITHMPTILVTTTETKPPKDYTFSLSFGNMSLFVSYAMLMRLHKAETAAYNR